jgi:hypothetical protein
MPDLSDYQQLSLVGLEIDSVGWKGAKLEAKFGAGYGSSAVVAPAGLHTWSLSSGLLPDEEAYGRLIEDLPRFQYYLGFFQEHTTGGRDVFEIEFRGRRYHASFVDAEISAEMLTIDLFSTEGVQVRQRKVPGIQYFEDGSIFDLANQPEVWGWYKADVGWDGTEGNWADQSGNGHDLARGGSIHASTAAAVQNGLDVIRFNPSTADTFLEASASPVIYEAFFVMQVREATFSSGAGLLTNDIGVPLVFGTNAGTTWNNNALGVAYEYRYNGELLAEAAQTAPMNEFAVVHVRYTTGLTLTNLQIGKKTNTAGTFLKADFGEIILCSASLSSVARADIINKLMSPLRWGIDA